MILRYFYIAEYNSIADDLDVNLGGKYKFFYKNKENELHITHDETYVEKLYVEYDVISDISAILGKNGAGKTTVLRIINSVFNGVDGKKYIIVFETEQNYLMYTNLERMGYNKNILEKKIQCIFQNYFDSYEILRNVGLIYFSNIFDKSSPFHGNSNLIDISTNHTFETFYAAKGNTENTENTSILAEYKSDCILKEIDFLLDIKNELDKEQFKLLFEFPTELKIGFVQNLPNFGHSRFCQNDEYDTLLKGIYEPMETFLCEEKMDSLIIFCNEVIFYLVFDFLYQLCQEEYYNSLKALRFWREKIEEQNWDLRSYYRDILCELESVNVFYELGMETFIEQEDNQEVNYKDIVDDFEDIQDVLNDLNDVEYYLVKKKILRIQNFITVRKWEKENRISVYLNEALYLLEELQTDLVIYDYDLYNLSYIYNVIQLIEKSYNLFVSGRGEEEIILNDEIDMEKIDVAMDADTANRVERLLDIIQLFIEFSSKYEFDIENRMLDVRLDNQDILKFVYVFRELQFKTVELITDRNDISSGHAAYLDMCARINSARKSGEIRQKENVIILIDEGDIYLHPEKQLAYMNNLLKLLQILYSGKKVQIVFTSNSPFIISDIQRANILYLENLNYKIRVTSGTVTNTFAANVNTLLLDSFFVDKGLIGEYAYEKINCLLKDIGDENISEEKYEYIRAIIGIIGEPMIQRKLEHMLLKNKKIFDVERTIQYYEQKIAKLKKINSGGEDDQYTN